MILVSFSGLGNNGVMETLALQSGPVTTGDHEPRVSRVSGVSTHIMQTSAAVGCYRPLQTFTAVARCETGDYKET